MIHSFNSLDTNSNGKAKKWGYFQFIATFESLFTLFLDQNYCFDSIRHHRKSTSFIVSCCKLLSDWANTVWQVCKYCSTNRDHFFLPTEIQPKSINVLHIVYYLVLFFLSKITYLYGFVWKDFHSYSLRGKISRFWPFLWMY